MFETCQICTILDMMVLGGAALLVIGGLYLTYKIIKALYEDRKKNRG
ncbi:hypothetical protein LCGC14_2494990 [marine sediment metagenome]|uniref:DUF3149 domain-containing protein n=1 Tax=marine sediment metagenome TaxID=412755 RepID=A0A0F9DXC7_9ZZZZ